MFNCGSTSSPVIMASYLECFDTLVHNGFVSGMFRYTGFADIALCNLSMSRIQHLNISKLRTSLDQLQNGVLKKDLNNS